MPPTNLVGLPRPYYVAAAAAEAAAGTSPHPHPSRLPGPDIQYCFLHPEHPLYWFCMTDGNAYCETCVREHPSDTTQDMRAVAEVCAVSNHRDTLSRMSESMAEHAEILARSRVYGMLELQSLVSKAIQVVNGVVTAAQALTSWEDEAAQAMSRAQTAVGVGLRCAVRCAGAGPTATSFPTPDSIAMCHAQWEALHCVQELGRAVHVPLWSRNVPYTGTGAGHPSCMTQQKTVRPSFPRPTSDGQHASY